MSVFWGLFPEIIPFLQKITKSFLPICTCSESKMDEGVYCITVRKIREPKQNFNFNSLSHVTSLMLI